MSSRTFSWSAAMIAALTVVSAGPAARADFALVSQNLVINQHDHLADFSLTFNQPPDFSTIDQFGIPENSFQYNFAGDYEPILDPFGPYILTAIVRGDEIHIDNTIRVRNPNGDGGADGGGWGPVVSAVPFQLIGDNLGFTIPTADLGYSRGNFQYEVFSLQDGSTTFDQTVTMVPLPSALYSGLVGLAVAASAAMWMRRRPRSV